MTKTPVRLRPTTDRSIGTTAFFRNRILFDTLLDELARAGRQHYFVFFHACSIGAEVYSLVIQYLLRGFSQQFSLRVQATDIEGGFVEYARNGQYPKEIVDGMTDQERAYFTVNAAATVRDDVKALVEFVAPCDFTNYQPHESFDVVSLLNCLVYVPQEIQAITLDRIATYNSDYLLTTAFHRESISADLQRNHYAPVLTHQREIHDAWIDRRVDTSAPLVPQAGIYTDWRLPAFAEIAGHEYLYCSIFRKTSPLQTQPQHD